MEKTGPCVKLIASGSLYLQKTAVMRPSLRSPHYVLHPVHLSVLCQILLKIGTSYNVQIFRRGCPHQV